MSRNNTGNPIGSTDYRDLQDNMRIADDFVNSATGQVVDRLGVTRRTIAGMESAFDSSIASLGYDLSLGDYGAGKTITDRGQVVLRDGEYYKAAASATLPLELTGVWGTDSGSLVGVGDAALRQELAADDGASKIGYLPAGTGAVATNVQNKLREFVSVKDFGAVGDGLTDDTAAIRAALGASYKVFIPAGIYLVSSPIRLRSRQQLIGDASSADAGSIILASNSVTWAADRGVVETSNFAWSPNSGQGPKPDYWHWGSIENINVRANSSADYGVVIWSAGEEAVLRRVSVSRAKKDNLFIGGYPAVLQVEDSSVWHAGRYGVFMSNHPDANFAPGISGADGGRTSGGSVRFFGLSGDFNASGHLFADGSQIVELSGLKSEYNNPCIVIDGGLYGGPRQRWSITGFRAEAGKDSTKDRTFIKILNSSKPQVFIGSGAAYNYQKLIDDTTTGESISDAGNSDGSFIFYDRFYTSYILGRKVHLPPACRIAGGPLDSYAELVMSAQHNAPTSSYALAWKATYSGTNTYQLLGEANSNKYKLISVHNTNANGGVEYCGWSPSDNTTVPLITFDGSCGISVGKSAARDKIGFLGANPIARPNITGSKAGNAALASLITALANLGLIQDSSS